MTVNVSASNMAPNAVANFSGDLLPGSLITLDGSVSNDPDGSPQPLSFLWQFAALPNDSLLSNQDINNAQLAIADFVPDVLGVYEVRLTVSDGDLSNTALLTISIDSLPVNIAPIAQAGNDQQVELGESVNLDGSASNDPDGGPATLSYLWQFLSVPSGSQTSNTSISNSSSALSEFLPDVAGSYALQLSVSDGEDTDTDSVIVVVNDILPQPEVCDVNGDLFIDQVDIGLIMARLNTPASGPNDRADGNGDGSINVLDARVCALRCTLPRCAPQPE